MRQSETEGRHRLRECHRNTEGSGPCRLPQGWSQGSLVEKAILSLRRNKTEPCRPVLGQGEAFLLPS